MANGSGKIPANAPHRRGPSSVSEERTEMAAFNTHSLAFGRRKPRLRKERSKPRAHFNSVSVSGPKISPICTFPRGSRAGAKFQSFTKAAVGTFPTRNDHQKHLLHEEHLAAEQVFSVPDTERGNPKPCCFLVAKLS